MLGILRTSLLSNIRERFARFHVSALCHGDVVVPHMGDSISEGTIAAVLKKQGDAITIDEVLFSIETDKVTIDCKATESGTVQNITVQSGSVVKPGQVVASITAGAGAAPSAPMAAASSASSSSAHAESSHGVRIPGIQFPTRRTASGERISDLPDDQQKKLLGHQDSAPKAAPPPASQPLSAGSTAGPAAAVKPKVVTTFLDSVPARRRLTAMEVELINSGGA